MNKTAANILSSLIPIKLARKKWRLIFAYGIIRSIHTVMQNKKLRSKNTSQPYYLAVCAIAKNEASYFEEWIEWHKKQGVEKFYIYDNESTDNTKAVLAPYIQSGLVEFIPWAGTKQQKNAYAHCLKMRKLETRWIAFIDLDEFIVPVKDESIPAFLTRFERYSAVEINWLIYGSGGALKKEAGGVMQRFKYRATDNHQMNRFVKSIVNPLRVVCVDAHIAAIPFGHSVDSHENPVKKFYKDRRPLLDAIRVNHYAVKSQEEFLTKHARGRATTSKKYEDSYLKRYDINDIKE